jgi:hypothetical protein
MRRPWFWALAIASIAAAAVQAQLQVPVLSQPTNGSTNQPVSVRLSWYVASPNAGTYTVEVATSQGFATTIFQSTGVTDTTVLTPALLLQTTYFWRVQHLLDGGIESSNWTAAWSFTTKAAPDTPSISSPANGSTGQQPNLTMSWASVPGAQTYQMQIDTNALFSATVMEQSGLTGTSVVAAGLGSHITYYWRVDAVSALGVIGPWSSTWSFTTEIYIGPGTPALAAPSNGATGQLLALTLNWSTAGNSASYAVQLSTVANFSTTISYQSGLSSTSAPVANLRSLTTYYWQVNARSSLVTGAWSAAWSFTTRSQTGVIPDNPYTPEQAPFALKNGILTYRIDHSCPVQMAFFDLRGRTEAIVRQHQSPGLYHIAVKNLHLPAGFYIAQFRAGGFSEKTAFMVQE